MQNSSSANIKHVVVLMFENRSFDHILGAMPGVNGVLDTAGNPKPEIYNYLHPLRPNQPGNVRQTPFPIAPGPSENAYIQGGAIDFDHDFSVMFTDLAGPGTTGVIHGVPQNNPFPTFPSTNSGFVSVNYQQFGSLPGNEGEPVFPYQYPIMSYFSWKSMQVFHKLAEEFVVCDNWFCDMPGHTAPNRAFMHCATTGDLYLENTDDVREPSSKDHLGPVVKRESIFQRLEKHGSTWKMYVPGSGGSGNLNNLDTCFLNDEVACKFWTGDDPTQTNCTSVPLSQFCTDAQSNNLPAYSFIMTFDSYGASMHPSAAVEPGENLLAGVYNALRNSPSWNDTLLIVNFDENGGIYDHVRPPRAVPPHPENLPLKVEVGGQEYVFDFSILGFRIPALLISPWLRKGIETQQLQNTSVLRFLQDRFCPLVPLHDPLQPPVSYLTQRDRFANSIQVVFDDFGLPVPRTDCPDTVTPYQISAYPTGICSNQAPADNVLQASPKKYMVDLTLEYLAALPGHPDSGKLVHRSFETVADLNNYISERTKAAIPYCKQRKSDQAPA